MGIQVLLQWGFVFIYHVLMNRNLYLEREVSVPGRRLHWNFPTLTYTTTTPLREVECRLSSIGLHCPGFSNASNFWGGVPRGCPKATPLSQARIQGVWVQGALAWVAPAGPLLPLTWSFSAFFCRRVTQCVWDGTRFGFKALGLVITRLTPLLAPVPWCTGVVSPPGRQRALSAQEAPSAPCVVGLQAYDCLECRAITPCVLICGQSPEAPIALGAEAGRGPGV